MQNPYVIRDRKNAMRKATEHAKKRAREMENRNIEENAINGGIKILKNLTLLSKPDLALLGTLLNT